MVNKNKIIINPKFFVIKKVKIRNKIKIIFIFDISVNNKNKIKNKIIKRNIIN